MRKIKLISLGVALALLAFPVRAQTPVVPGTLLAPAAKGQQQQFQMWPVDASGYLKVDVAAGGGSGGTSSNFSSAFPATGTAVGFSNGTNMVPGLVDGSGYLEVNVKAGGGGGTADEAAFTAGSSVFNPGGGFYQTTATSNALTNGQSGMWQMTAQRAGFVNPRNSSGTEIFTSGAAGYVQFPSAQSVNATLQASATTAIGKVDPNTAANWGIVAQGASITGAVGTLMQGSVTTGAPSYTTAQISPLSLDTAGNLRVNVVTGGGSGGTSLADGATFTIGATSETPAACTYVNGGITVTTGKSSVLSCTSAGSLHTTVDNTNANITPGDTISTATYAGASPTIGVALLWNGTTYDRQKSVSTGVASVGVASGGIASGAIASGAIASGAIASGAIASGAVASGAFASGAFAAGSFVNATAGDPCMFAGKKTASFSTGTSGTQLIAGTGSTNTYICSLAVIASAAANFSLVVGSGSSVCTSGTPLAIYGGTTTASAGMSLAANGGLTAGNGGGTIASDLAAAAQGYNVCIGINGTSTLAGTITYIQR